MSPTTLLLVARLATSNEEVKQRVNLHEFDVLSATNLAEVQAAFSSARIDHVIMGAGIDLDDRLAIVEHVFRSSETTTVHMKDRAGGKPSYLPFVQAVVSGLREYISIRAEVS